MASRVVDMATKRKELLMNNKLKVAWDLSIPVIDIFAKLRERSLDLSGCSKLRELPTFIDELTTLESLDLSGCSQLKELPTSIDKLITLQSLNLSGCSQLKELPTSINKLIIL
jgi:Leucine-rich repeat (LRR) protein